MKRLIALLLALILALSCFAGCKKEPEPQPSTEATVPVEPGLELEENGIVYESLAQKAVIKTALAYLARRTRIQYDDTRLTGTGTPVMYRWQHGVRQYPESYTSQYIGYTNCAAFTYDVYWSALDMKIGGYTTKNLTDVGGKQRIFSYYPKGTETTEEQAAVMEKFLSKLKPADLIIVRYNGAKDGNGHAMLYVGKDVLQGVEGAKEGHDIIHSTGGSYQYGDRTEKYESKGTVQTMGTSRFFEESSSLYVFSKLKSIVILRPLEVYNKEIPENTLNRMRNMNNVVAEKLSSHALGHTASPGDTVAYTFSVTNNNEQAVTVTVEDTVPKFTTLKEADKTDICSVSGDKLTWQLTVPAKTTANLCYSVTINADAAAGQEIAGNKATVGGISVPCHSVFVGRTLTLQEQNDLAAGVEALADRRLLRDKDLVNALYSKALKVETIWTEEFDGVWANLWQNFEDLSYVNPHSPYVNAIAPGLLGGRNVLSRNLAADNMTQYMRLEGIRTRLPYADQLMVGDILMGELGPGETERVMYLYTGQQMVNLLSGKEIEYKSVEECLNPVMSYKRFVVLRPSLLLDNQA